LNRSLPPLCALVLGLLFAGLAHAQEAGQQAGQSFSKQVTKTLSARYLLYLPKEYGKDAAAKWPLILFLHGAGESGDNLEVVKKHGPPKLVAEGKELPFIVVSPQCPSRAEGWNPEVLAALLDEVAQKYVVDPDRIYLTGLSMGGFGTWNLAAAYPDRFAAIAPICGGGQRRMARRLRALPIWVFHGAKDTSVPLRESEEMVEALKAANGNVKFTVYPEAGHDSWTETYNNPELFAWFLQHRRGARAP
jgi:predicted peptidase